MGNDSFCDNPQCIYHGVDTPSDQYHLEIVLNTGSTDNKLIQDIFGNTQNTTIQRYKLRLPDGQFLKFCYQCKSAIDMIYPMRENKS